MTRCEECGYDWDADPIDIAVFADRYAKPLTRFLPADDPDVVLRTRPEPTVWSALEYAAHVRDAFGFYGGRIGRALSEDRPQFSPRDPDAVCEERRYNEEDPAATLVGLAAAANDLAALLADLDDAQWERVGVGIDGDERTVRVLARRAAHEGSHHLLDIGRVLRHVRQTLER
ncbi:MAG TPA: DinB family protein [Acidimicrobiales bacterium]|nr:DinB family protein [Acidimicrobiales bacterium]